MPACKKHVKRESTKTRKALVKLQNVEIAQSQNNDIILTRAKRKADVSPLKNEKIKRSALGNLTNNVVNKINYDQKGNVNNLKSEKNDISKISQPTKSKLVLKSNDENVMMPPLNAQILKPTKVVTRSVAKNSNANLILTQLPPISTFINQDQEQKIITTSTTAKTKEKNAKTSEKANSKPTTRRISNEFEKTEDSLYMSALEDMPSTDSDSLRLSENFDSNKQLAHKDMNKRLTRSSTLGELSAMSIDEENENDYLPIPSPIKNRRPSLPEGVIDFDSECMNDPYQVAEYAMDIFNYLKKREDDFLIEDYMGQQVNISKWMRSLLVDWMVEVQETFELNHETLYLAVKLVDLYLCKQTIVKDKLQLLGAGALFIACKYDERCPPLVDDFLYICDGAYEHDEIISMEKKILKAVNFDLGIPLSYRFLRRYARCAKVPMSTLTLARYILEFSLMDYATIRLSDSKMASAVLFMALKMTGTENAWTKTLEYYSGYTFEDFAFIIPILNNGLHRKPRETIKTIRNKYSHKIFFEVAKIPLLSNEKLLEDTGTNSTNNNKTDLK